MATPRGLDPGGRVSRSDVREGAQSTSSIVQGVFFFFLNLKSHNLACRRFYAKLCEGFRKLIQNVGLRLVFFWLMSERFSQKDGRKSNRGKQQVSSTPHTYSAL